MTLFGYGITTKAIAKKFGNCNIYDDLFLQDSVDEYGNRLFPANKFDENKSDLEVTSPGISPSNLLIKKAKNLISEYDLFYDVMPFSIWITGTNGKTTTTSMLQHLLKKRGSLAGGNIGTPLGELDENAPIWILETSSFTIHYTKYAKPDIFIILPIKDDHISWHGSFKDYENDKLKPIANMNEGDIVILPSKYKTFPICNDVAHKIFYDNSQDLANYFKIDTTKISFKEPFLLDSILAMAADKILFGEIDYDLINSYKMDEHKIEEFRDKKNRLWVNDSKATNVDATIEALKRYKNKKIYLILGGDDKGIDLRVLFEFLENIDVEIFAIGSNSDKIELLAKNISKKVKNIKFLEKAVQDIDKIHSSNSVAILSPSAASLDQFKSYKQRGSLFKEFVNNL